MERAVLQNNACIQSSSPSPFLPPSLPLSSLLPSFFLPSDTVPGLLRAQIPAQKHSILAAATRTPVHALASPPPPGRIGRAPHIAVNQICMPSSHPGRDRPISETSLLHRSPHWRCEHLLHEPHPPPPSPPAVLQSQAGKLCNQTPCILRSGKVHEAQD
jgi:hypothetical protein